MTCGLPVHWDALHLGPGGMTVQAGSKAGQAGQSWTMLRGGGANTGGNKGRSPQAGSGQGGHKHCTAKAGCLFRMGMSRGSAHPGCSRSGHSAKQFYSCLRPCERGCSGPAGHILLDPQTYACYSFIPACDHVRGGAQALQATSYWTHPQTYTCYRHARAHNKHLVIIVEQRPLKQRHNTGPQGLHLRSITRAHARTHMAVWV